MGEWSEWSDCSCTCDGVAHRSRRVVRYGYGSGKWCGNFLNTSAQDSGEFAATKEVKACNVDHAACRGPQPVDCHWSGWEPRKCTLWNEDEDAFSDAEEVKCGGGQRRLQRFIIQDAKFGGRPCDGPSEITEPCATQPCDAPKQKNCEWNEWSKWSVCDKCGGQKRRTRTIKQMPKNGGVCGMRDEDVFENMASEEIAACRRECHDEVYCVWSDWTDGTCDAECGPGGRMVRTRELVGQSTKPETLYASDAVVPQHRFQDLLVSFGCGSLVTCLVAVVTFRMFRQDQSRSFVRAADEYTTGAE